MEEEEDTVSAGPSRPRRGSVDQNATSTGDLSTLGDLGRPGTARKPGRPKARVLAAKGSAKPAKRPEKANASFNKTLRQPPKRDRPAEVMNYQTLNEALARELNEERMKTQEFTKVVQEHSDRFSDLTLEHRRLTYLYEKSCQETSRHVSAAVRAAQKTALEAAVHDIEVLQNNARSHGSQLRKLREEMSSVERSHEKHAEELSSIMRRLQESLDDCNASIQNDDEVIVDDVVERSSRRAVPSKTLFTSGRTTFSPRLTASASSSQSDTPPNQISVNSRRRRAVNSVQQQPVRQRQRGVALPHVSGTAIRQVNIRVGRLSMPGTSNSHPDGDGGRGSPEVVEIDCDDTAPSTQEPQPSSEHDTEENGDLSSSSMDMTTISRDGVIDVRDDVPEPLASDQEEDMPSPTQTYPDILNSAAVDLANDDDDDVTMEDDQPDSSSSRRQRLTAVESQGDDSENEVEPRPGKRNGVSGDEETGSGKKSKTSPESRLSSRKSRVSKAPSLSASQAQRKLKSLRRRSSLFDDNVDPVPSTSAAARQVESTEEEDEEEENGQDEEAEAKTYDRSRNEIGKVGATGKKSDEDKPGNVRVTLQRMTAGADAANDHESDEDEVDTTVEHEQHVENEPTSSNASREGSVEIQTEGRSRRNASKAVSYKEPSLNQKLRRGDPTSDPLSLELAPSLIRRSKKQKSHGGIRTKSKPKKKE